MTNVLPSNVIASLRERRKRLEKHDCQGERRIVPAAPKPGRNSIWGRNMMNNVFEAIELDEGLEAAIDAFRQKINQYEQGRAS